MTNNTTLNGNNTLGGLNMKDFYKGMGLEGLKQMVESNPAAFMGIKEIAEAMAELQIEAINNKKEGGNNMKQETETKSTEGGKAMEQQTENKQGGNKMEVYKLSSLEKEGYMDGVTYILKHFGRKGLQGLEKIGVKVAVVSVKEKAALKDIVYRATVVAGAEWIKSELDNDLIDLAGSVFQTYQIVRVGIDLYKIYNSFNKITLKDVEALDALIDSLISEEKAYEESDNEEEDI